MSTRLEVVQGPRRGAKFTFDGRDNFIVGRAESAHFQLPKNDRLVSRVHFMIEFNPPLCRVTDLGSRNGTKVNGKRVKKADLKHGDLIQAGMTAFRVHFDRAAGSQDRRDAQAPPPETEDYRPKQVEDTVAADSAPKAKAETPPPRIEGYGISREIGSGGMGVVYLATRLSDGRKVAVKTIRPAVSGSQEDVDRFLREARVLSSLRHPGIVSFEEVGQAGELLFFAMEYVQGNDAGREIKKYKRVAIGPVVHIICQALAALQYAHGQGYVHRDVKPSNLLLAKNEERTECKLADFGLARAYNASPLSGLTMMGDVGGTLPYMPPEQITNYRFARPPADQYATAATLYHLLTGQYVFDLHGLSAERQISTILCEPHAPIQQRRGDVPDGLAWVIDRGLEKDPEKRFPDADAFRQALSPYATPMIDADQRE